MASDVTYSTNSAEIGCQQHVDFDCAQPAEDPRTLCIEPKCEEAPEPLDLSRVRVVQSTGARLVEIEDWAPVERNSIRAVFSLTLTTIGLTIKGCMLRQSFDGSYFIAMPALPQVSDGRLRVDQKGRISYRSILQFTDKESYKRFERLVLETLKRLGLIEACPPNTNREACG